MAEVAQTLMRSALAHLDLESYASAAAGAHTGVRLQERAHHGRLSLRGDPGDRAFMAAAGQALDIVLPTEPNTTARTGEVTAIWLGPDEWLLTAENGGVQALHDRLRDGLAGLETAIVDVSDASTVIGLSGPHTRDVLAKGTPLDLHASVFTSGRVAQTLIAQADVVLHRIDIGKREASFDIHVRRSFAEYLWLWLADAAMEYGVGVDR